MAVINLISGPRNISTALMYSFAQRDDTSVMDEPFYALYLSKSNADHPGRDEVLSSLSSDESTIKQQIEAERIKPLVFVKNMAHHMEVMEAPLIKKSINIFLIRDPALIIASYAQVIERPVMRDIGVAYQFELFKKLQGLPEPVIVLDSGLLLQNPESVLQQVCLKCSIDFQTAMLAWKPGAKPYDGVWAKYWYASVHQSTGFQKQQARTRKLPGHLSDLYAQAMGYYEKLLPFSLKA